MSEPSPREWVRICQECMHKQVTPPPPNDKTAFERWTNKKCVKCKSAGLDYGKWRDVRPS